VATKIVSVGKGIGHFFGALEIDGFIDKDEFKKQIDDWIHVFRNTKPAPDTNGPLIPGDPEREAHAIRSKDGIPLIKPVVDDLLDIASKTGIEFKSS
jgi:LDH2 family malate/lactate/ureidoglycolate dehydrogenase